MDTEQSVTEAPQEKPLQNVDTVTTVDPPEAAFLHGRALILVTFALLASVFMVALDNAIISTAIPRITSEFNSLDDVGWYGSAYLLTQMSLQPTFGKIYTLFDIKRVFLTALLIFEIGSVVCAAAPNSNSFITGRAVAGLGAAGIFCGGLTILGLAVVEKKRPLFMGFIGGIYGISSVLGPTLGGLFTDTPKLTWRFCFWINLPFGGIAVAIIIFLYKPASAGLDPSMKIWQKVLKLGIWSATILTGTITCLLFGVSWGGIKYPWADSRVWGCLLGAGLLLAVFVLIQFRNGDESLIPTRVISQRSIAISCVFTCLLQIAMMAQAYYLPFFFQAAQGTTAKVSGVQILPSGITIAIATLFGGTLITMMGYYVPFMWAGAAIFTVGCYLLHTLVRSSTIKAWFGYQVIVGIGYGFAVQIPYLAVQVVIVSLDRPLANALVSLFQALGGALGLSIAENVFQTSLIERLDKIQNINVTSIIASGGTGLESIVSPSQLDPVRNVAFLVSVGAAGAAFVTSLAMEWRRIGAKKDTPEMTDNSA